MQMLALLVTIVLFAQAADAFVVEPWYENLAQFGPLDRDYDAGWDFRPMTLIDDYTFFIANLSGSPNHPFMFVSPNAEPFPPLGERNWKQGKYGVGTNYSLIPGGGGGRYPFKGIFDLTVYTAGHPERPNTYSLDTSNPRRPQVTIDTARQIVVGDGNNTVLLKFSENVTAPLNASLVHLLTDDAVWDSTTTTVEWVDRGWDGTYHVFARGVEHPVPEWEGQVDILVDDGVAVSKTNGLEASGSTFSYMHLRPEAVSTPKRGKWGPLVSLRDASGALPDPHGDMQSGGWFVTPIHAVVVPHPRKIFLSGWVRRDGLPCAGGERAGGRRRASLTFEVSVEEIDAAGDVGSLNVRRIDESAEYPFEDPSIGRDVNGSDGSTFRRQDGHLIAGDAIYCAGHTHLVDGRVLYFGGARYANISEAGEHEWGLSYARILDPESGRFERVKGFPAPLGRSWYPTTGRMADGRVLVTGAFRDYSSERCFAAGTLDRPDLPKCLNPQVNVFDVEKYDAGQDPWSVVLDEAHADHDIDPGIREYTRIFVLPEAVTYDGRQWSLFALGKAGRVVFIDVDPSTPLDRRTYKPPNGKRPGNCGEASDQSTAVPLLTSRGAELMIMGGCTGDRETMQSVDVYNVASDSWIRVPAGVGRGVPASILLPDGRVLLISGETPWLDQNERQFSERRPDRSLWGPADARIVQIFDPEAQTVTTEDTDGTADVFRGYHNMAALLHDGRILVGGGFNQWGDVGCENPNLRIYSPSYLDFGDAARPLIHSFSSNGTSSKLVPGQRGLRIEYSGPSPDPEKGAALLAAQAFTHSYGQNQRYVRLRIASIASDHIVVDLPEEPVLLTGPYHLFLVSEDGVPSESVGVRVAHAHTRHSHDTKSLPTGAVVACSVVAVLLAVAIAHAVTRRREMCNEGCCGKWGFASTAGEAPDEVNAMPSDDAYAYESL